MKLVTYIQSIQELNEISPECNSIEIILGHKNLSRFGKLTTDEFHEIAQECMQRNVSVVLEWDILMTENEFPRAVETLNLLNLEMVHSIRTQDPGAFQYCLDNLHHPLQINVENGNHNLTGIKSWIDLGDGRVEKVILSIELPQKVIKAYRSELKTRIEYLGLGRILLFYTPRKLVSPAFTDHDDDRELASFQSDFIQVLGSSEESPHRGFPIIENQHGSFMFHIKDQFLLSHLEDIQDAGIDDLRIDLRWGHSLSLINKINSLFTNNAIAIVEEIKELYGKDLTRGYFHVNKTDVLFNKLKNQGIVRKDGDFLGHVLDAKKSSYIAFLSQTDREIKVGDVIFYITPQGKEINSKIYELTDSSRHNLSHARKGELVFINYTRGVTQKTAIYFRS